MNTTDLTTTALPPDLRRCGPVRLPSHRGARAASPQLWACQYPYPSLRADGPDDSCQGCPAWNELARRRTAPAA